MARHDELEARVNELTSQLNKVWAELVELKNGQKPPGWTWHWPPGYPQVLEWKPDCKCPPGSLCLNAACPRRVVVASAVDSKPNS